jgi:hypothetical protein
METAVQAPIHVATAASAVQAMAKPGAPTTSVSYRLISSLLCSRFT